VICWFQSFHRGLGRRKVDRANVLGKKAKTYKRDFPKKSNSFYSGTVRKYNSVSQIFKAPSRMRISALEASLNNAENKNINMNDTNSNNDIDSDWIATHTNGNFFLLSLNNFLKKKAKKMKIFLKFQVVKVQIILQMFQIRVENLMMMHQRLI
jgi:hypothetical protein